MAPNTPISQDNVFATSVTPARDPNGTVPSDPALNSTETVHFETGSQTPDDKPTSREAIQAYRVAVMKQVRRMRLVAKKGPAKIVTRYTRRGKPVY